MFGFPIADLLDHGICLIWLEWYLYRNGLRCFHGGHTEWHLCRPRRTFPCLAGGLATAPPCTKPRFVEASSLVHTKERIGRSRTYGQSADTRNRTKSNKCVYEIIMYWSEEDQAFIAEVPELPGCAADGGTYQEAVANVQVIIQRWIETAKELGRPIPQSKGRLMYA